MGFLFGKKKEPSSVPQTANLKTRDFGTNQASIPLPIFYGRGKLGGHYISHIYDSKARKITKKVGSGKMAQTITVGYNYEGSYAMALCLGPCDRITKVWANDKGIWSGDIWRGSSNLTTISTKLGDMRFYFGTPNSPKDSWLSSISGDMPNFRHISYASFRRQFFGETTSPPAITFRVQKHPQILPISTHNLNDEAVLPEIIYDLLVNPVYGAGIDPAKINTQSFVEASETTIAEGLAVSVVIDQSRDLRSVLGDLLTYCNGALIFKNGKLHIVLQRDSVAVPPLIGLSALLDEPEIERDGWESTHSETRVIFTNGDREFESDVSVYTDLANVAISGLTQREFQRPFITRSNIAQKMAANIGTQSGLPLAKVKAQLQPSYAETLNPGDPITLEYPPLSIVSLPLIVKKMTIAGPDRPRVTIEADQDPSRLQEATFAALPPPLEVVPTTGPQNSNFRIAAIPPSLRPSNTDGLVLATERPNPLIVGGVIYSNWDPLATWKWEQNFTNYPAKATLNRWKAESSNWVLDLTIDHDFDSEELAVLKDDLSEIWVCAVLRNVDTENLPNVDEHRVVSSWFRHVPGGVFDLVAPNQWEIEVFPAEHGQTLVPETPAIPGPHASGFHPCSTLYIGRMTDFTFIRTNSMNFERSGGNDISDVNQIRYFRVLTSTDSEIEELATASEQRFERLNTTMNPGGSLFSEWGASLPVSSW